MTNGQVEGWKIVAKLEAFDGDFDGAAPLVARQLQRR
jgi:hypothetical protein